VTASLPLRGSADEFGGSSKTPGNSVLKVNMSVEAGQNRTLILPDTITTKWTSPLGEFPLSTSSPDSHESLSLWKSTIGTSNTEPSSKSWPPGLVIQPTRRSKSPSRKVVKSRLVNIFQRLGVEDEHRLADIMSRLVTHVELGGVFERDCTEVIDYSRRWLWSLLYTRVLIRWRIFQHSRRPLNSL
jgi:hypothetical protein